MLTWQNLSLVYNFEIGRTLNIQELLFIVKRSSLKLKTWLKKGIISFFWLEIALPDILFSRHAMIVQENIRGQWYKAFLSVIYEFL